MNGTNSNVESNTPTPKRKASMSAHVNIHVDSGDYCSVTHGPQGRIGIGSISVLPEELEDFISALREAVQAVMRGPQQ